MNFGGPGYCRFEFTFEDLDTAYENAEVRLRPSFDLDNTATARTQLDDLQISVGAFGGNRAEGQIVATGETDCEVTGFTVVEGSATTNGQRVDLVNGYEFETDKRTDDALPISIDGN
jgi:hypothetical protein